MTGLLVVALLLGLGFGVAAVSGVLQRSGLVDDVRTRSGPLTVQSQQLYRALSDADATAATAFLSGGIETPAASRRYQKDIAAASKALATTAGSGGADADAVEQLTTQLPVYTGLVETARVYNRQGLPLGAAYLREASGLMREKLLPAAQRLYRAETAQLADDRDGAALFPFVAVPLGLLLLAGLVVGQVWLTRRTNRLVNPGLLAASVAAVLGLLWLTVSWGALAADLRDGETHGSAQVQTFAQARLLALQARADESLTLVARGNGASFERDFQRRMTDLVGRDGKGGLLGAAYDGADADMRRALDGAVADVAAWRGAHRQVRALDDGGRYPEAVDLAIGAEKGSAATAFGALDDRLGGAIDAANGRSGRAADAADGTQTGAAVGLGLLTVVVVVGAAVGIQRRAAEYR
ncbi:hypothetical protein [Actinocatenispora rupis]|uniref:hypothetical protein n=1 Tax=Actinocatenispora rupis TaxID=519421 RepID=UPI00194490AE|nr:hypothetical protein [Actinocatenispora rupis]